ncbi:hypothetical protein ACTXT7_002881 [Hymenolepis weldensis]
MADLSAKLVITCLMSIHRYPIREITITVVRFGRSSISHLKNSMMPASKQEKSNNSSPRRRLPSLRRRSLQGFTALEVVPLNESSRATTLPSPHNPSTVKFAITSDSGPPPSGQAKVTYDNSAIYQPMPNVGSSRSSDPSQVKFTVEVKLLNDEQDALLIDVNVSLRRRDWASALSYIPQTPPPRLSALLSSSLCSRDHLRHPFVYSRSAEHLTDSKLNMISGMALIRQGTQ